MAKIPTSPQALHNVRQSYRLCAWPALPTNPNLDLDTIQWLPRHTKIQLKIGSSLGNIIGDTQQLDKDTFSICWRNLSIGLGIYLPSTGKGNYPVNPQHTKLYITVHAPLRELGPGTIGSQHFGPDNWVALGTMLLWSCREQNIFVRIIGRYPHDNYELRMYNFQYFHSPPVQAAGRLIGFDLALINHEKPWEDCRVTTNPLQGRFCAVATIGMYPLLDQLEHDRKCLELFGLSAPSQVVTFRNMQQGSNGGPTWDFKALGFSNNRCDDFNREFVLPSQLKSELYSQQLNRVQVFHEDWSKRAPLFEGITLRGIGDVILLVTHPDIRVKGLRRHVLAEGNPFLDCDGNPIHFRDHRTKGDITKVFLMKHATFDLEERQSAPSPPPVSVHASIANSAMEDLDVVHPFSKSPTRYPRSSPGFLNRGRLNRVLEFGKSNEIGRRPGWPNLSAAEQEWTPPQDDYLDGVKLPYIGHDYSSYFLYGQNGDEIPGGRSKPARCQATSRPTLLPPEWRKHPFGWSCGNCLPCKLGYRPSD